MKVFQPLFCILLSGIFLVFSPALSAENTESQLSTSFTQTRLTGLNWRRQSALGTQYYKVQAFKNGSIFSPETAVTQLPDSLPKTSILLLDQSGRTELISSSVAYTLTYYGWAVPTALGTNSSRAYVASYMLLGGASFFVPFMATRSGLITKGMARGFTYGAFLGITHGFGFAFLAQGDEIDGRLGLGTSVVTSLLEAKLLMGYARSHNLSPGHVSLMGHLGIWCGGLAAPLPYFAESESLRVYAASYLIGSGLGIYAGNKLARKISVAEGDPQVMTTSGALGSLLAIAMVNSFSDDFNRGSLATLLAGTAGGLGYGLYKIKNQDYTANNANLITLGSLAGGLVGLGAVFVLTDSSSEEAYFWGAATSAIGGFFLTEYLVREKANAKLGSLQIQINPMAVRQIIKPDPATLTSRNQHMPQPLVNASLKF